MIERSEFMNSNYINELVEKIKMLSEDKITTIAELTGYNPEKNFVNPLKQGEIFNELKNECKNKGINIEIIRDEIGGLAFYYKFKKINDTIK